jgi:hypothetical protein
MIGIILSSHLERFGHQLTPDGVRLAFNGGDGLIGGSMVTRAHGLLMEAIGVPYQARELSEGAERETSEAVMDVARAYVRVARAWLFGEGSLDEALRSASEAMVTGRHAFRVAEVMRRNRGAFREAVRGELTGDPEEPWVLIYYDALMRYYQIVATSGRAPASAVILPLSVYPSVLLCYLAGEVDTRTFSWVYSDLVTSIDALPTPPPRNLGLAEAVLEAVARLTE